MKKILQCIAHSEITRLTFDPCILIYYFQRAYRIPKAGNLVHEIQIQENASIREVKFYGRLENFRF